MYRLMLKKGGTVDNPLYGFLTDNINGEIKVREFSNEKDADAVIESMLNKGTIKITDVLIATVKEIHAYADLYGHNDNDGDDSAGGADKEEDPVTPDKKPELEPDPVPTLNKFNITVNKLAADGSTHVPNDENIGVSTGNQNAIIINKTGETEWTVNTTGTLQTFTSTNPAQADNAYSWIGIMVDTGLDDIKKVSVNGNLLTENDVLDAESVGIRLENGTTGSFILWLKAEALEVDNRTLTLSAEGMENVTITIKKA